MLGGPTAADCQLHKLVIVTPARLVARAGRQGA
jgi:hypothetical protein